MTKTKTKTNTKTMTRSFIKKSSCIHKLYCGAIHEYSKKIGYGLTFDKDTDKDKDKCNDKDKDKDNGDEKTQHVPYF